MREKEKDRYIKYKVFEESFDARKWYTEAFLLQKLAYRHLNPVSKKWNLVNDFTDYEHSSASFYERGITSMET